MLFSSLKHSHFNPARFFPVPKMLSMPFAGIDISEGAVRAMKLREVSGGFRVEKYFQEILPAGTIASGNINDKNPILKALESVRKEFRVQFIKSSLPDEKTYLFRAEVPHAKSGDLKESIEFLLEENVPLNPADCHFEYSVIPGAPIHEHVPVIVSVVSKDLVSLHMSLFHSAGLLPISFEIRTQAMANALIERDDMRSALLVHIGHAKTTIAVVEGGIVQFSSVVMVGGININSAVARTFSISEKEAEEMKGKKSFVNTESNQDFFSSLLNSISVIKDEMKKVVSYWESRGGDAPESAKKIGRIILSGKNAVVAGLREYIEEEMKRKTEIGNVWTNVASEDEYIPPIISADSLSFSSTVGLSLPWPVISSNCHA